MTNENSAATSTATTFCVGRFQIDLPAGSSINGGSFKYDFIRISPKEAVSWEGFEKLAKERESTLKAAKHDTGQSMLMQVARPATDTMILASWKAEFSSVLADVVGYRWIDGQLFVLKDEVSSRKLEFGISRMRDALARLRARAENDIPTDDGYCFAGGFIANPDWENEEASMDIDIAGHPDAFVSVWIYPLASHKHDKPLLERMGGLAQVLGNLATAVHVLRKGDRQLGPYKGQEYLASAPGSGGMRGHAFVWETQGEGTLDTPAIKIELTTGHQDAKGNPQKASFTDKEAMQLWDDVLNSFRLRPPARR